MQQVRGEELNFFSDAGAVNDTRSPAGEPIAPTRHGVTPSPEEVVLGIQGDSLLPERVSFVPQTRRLT